MSDTDSIATCKTCSDTGWETLFDVETVRSNKAATAVRRCRRGCDLRPDEGVRVVYAPRDQPEREHPTEPVSFS